MKSSSLLWLGDEEVGRGDDNRQPLPSNDEGHNVHCRVMAKYDPLREYLRNDGSKRVTMTFEQISRLIEREGRSDLPLACDLKAARLWDR